MEPVIFHPEDNKTKSNTETSSTAVDSSNTVPAAPTPPLESVKTPQFDTPPPESHHKEILPSLAIPEGTSGKHLKRTAVKRAAKYFVLTYVLVTIAGIAVVSILG